MRSNPIVGFLPCRKGSERVREKNCRPFAGVDGGLFAIKLDQLLQVPCLDLIIVSTDDERVMEIVDQRPQEQRNRIRLVERAKDLSSSSASTDALVLHVSEITSEFSEADLVVWTHATAPFFDTSHYLDAIDVFLRESSAGHSDSLMSVTRVQDFLWDETGPVNYDRNRERWPRTQTLPSWWKVNSAVFIASLGIYRRHGDRVGIRPAFYETDSIVGFDIDWPDDFRLAEFIWKSGRRPGGEPDAP